MKKLFKNIKQSKGFALLFAVLAASVLLSIGLSIFTITVKELALSSYARESQFSFYAADSGAECALYWDLKGNSGYTFATSTGDTVGSSSITCGNNTLPLTVSSSDAWDETITFTMPLNDATNENYCALVTVAKTDTLHTGISSTNISSRGYNNCSTSGSVPNVVDTPLWTNPNLVERALNVTY